VTAKADLFIPAEARASLEMPPFWGRLTALAPQCAIFLSHFEVPAGRLLVLSFELGRGGFAEVRARIRSARRDPDGYFGYELDFVDAAQRAALKAALIEAFPSIKL